MVAACGLRRVAQIRLLPAGFAGLLLSHFQRKSQLEIVADGVGAEVLEEAAGIVVHPKLGPVDGGGAFEAQAVVGQALQRNRKLHWLGDAFERELAGGRAAAYFAHHKYGRGVFLGVEEIFAPQVLG